MDAGLVELIEGQSADELLVEAANRLCDHGRVVSPRGMRTLEIEHAMLVLNDPQRSIVTLPARNLSRRYLDAEMDWYLHGTYDPAPMASHAQFWRALVTEGKQAHSNYGMLALREVWNGKTQAQWCIDCLREDPDTRQAVIDYNLPQHKVEGHQDFPCTMTQQFRQHDRLLDSLVVMRSNDLVRGFCYDVVWFTWLQAHIAKELGLGLGVYRHYAASLHVYEAHFPMLKSIASQT